VRIGRLEVWPATELLVVATFTVLLYLLLGDTPERLQTALRLTLLGYVLVQGPRLLHELGHAVAGQRAGRPARRLVWTVLASFCDFQAEAQTLRGEPPAPLPRRVALAGPPVNGVLGLLLLGAFLLAGATWDPSTRELVCLVGWLNVAGLGNLLPAPGTDGAYVWGQPWTVRPRALAYVPGFALAVVLGIGGTSLLLPDGVTHATFGRLDTWVFLAVWTIIVAVFARRLLIPRPAGE